MILFASMLLFAKNQRAEAQEATPDLHMLLNLDLFGAQPAGSSSGADDSGNDPEAPSMLDQIRTLNALGYLAKGAQPPVTPASDDGSQQSPSDGDEGEAPQL